MSAHSATQGEAREEEMRQTEPVNTDARPPREAGIVHTNDSPEEGEALAMQKLADEDRAQNRSPPPESEGADSLAGVNYVCGFFHWRVARHVLFLIVVGVVMGFPIGINGIFSMLQTYSEQCSLYTTEKACGGVLNQDCTWRAGACEWTVGMCSQFTRDECRDQGYMRCYYDYGAGVCTNRSGFTSLYAGIFASAGSVTSILLGCFAGDILAMFHHRKAIMTSGALYVFCSILLHAGVATNEYWVSTIGRFLSGIVFVFTTVPAMTYVHQNGPERYKQVLTSLFCVTLNLGTTFAGVIGAGMGLGVNFGGGGGDLYGLFQGFLAISTFVGVLGVMTGFLIEESPYWGKEADEADEEEKDATEEKRAAKNSVDQLEHVDDAELLRRVDEMEKQRGIDVAEYGWLPMTPRLLVGIAAAGIVQLTGISAFMNYAPAITGNVGFHPLVGNIVLNVWNVFCAACSVLILAVTSNLRAVFLFGTVTASAACIVMGVVAMPGVVHNDNARNGVSIAMIAVYLLVFQSCIGCTFYPLSQEMFPLSFRPRGSSVMQTAQIVFGFVISVFFPIAREGLSGGASGNQNKGLAIVFLFFGVIGFIGLVIVFFFLQPWTAEDERRYREKHGGHGERAAVQAEEAAQ